mgnify:FL=1
MFYLLKFIFVIEKGGCLQRAAAPTEENTNGEDFEYRGRGISDQGCGS